jgi:exosortase/archaeosortase
MITVYGVPAHPLLVHAVVVLLPLATFGGLAIAVRSSWRRRFGIAVLGVTIAGVAAVPIAQQTGEQLEDALRASLPPGTPLQPSLEDHVSLGNDLLPFAIAFGVAVLLLYVTGLLADRGDNVAWKRVALVAAALVVFTGVATTVETVRIGHTGAESVWKGVGGTS